MGAGGAWGMFSKQLLWEINCGPKRWEAFEIEKWSLLCYNLINIIGIHCWNLIYLLFFYYKNLGLIIDLENTEKQTHIQMYSNSEQLRKNTLLRTAANMILLDTALPTPALRCLSSNLSSMDILGPGELAPRNSCIGVFPWYRLRTLAKLCFLLPPFQNCESQYPETLVIFLLHSLGQASPTWR